MPAQVEAATPAPTVAFLTPLDTVEVPHEDVQDAIALVTAKQGKSFDPKQHRISQFDLQQALLSAMIDTLMKQLYHTQEQPLARTLKARCALIAQLQRWHRQTRQERLVHISQRAHTWRLTVGMPVAA